MVGHWICKIEVTEPAIGKIQMHLFTQPPLRADTKAISNQKHADQEFWINRRAACVTIEFRKMSPNAAQIHKPIYRA